MSGSQPGKASPVIASAASAASRHAMRPINGSHGGPSILASLLPSNENSRNALLYCSLLALQFGLQPLISSRFTSQGVSKSSVVIAIELQKIVIAAIVLYAGPSVEIEKIRETWSLKESLRTAALPATLYAIQNLCIQYGYSYLDSMTFSLLNQTKVSLAVCIESSCLWVFTEIVISLPFPVTLHYPLFP
jgi:hypothetical protein